MRRWPVLSLAFVSAFVAASGAHHVARGQEGGQPQSPTPAAPEPSAVLAEARAALGGETRLAAITSFVAVGRTRQVQGDNLVPIEFEIACELPDRCVRREEVPARRSGTTMRGFSGDALIQFPAPPGGPLGRGGLLVGPGGNGPARTGGPPGAPMSDPAAARVTAIKQEFVRLWLGMFAGSFPSVPLSFTYLAQAEAPQGRAHVLLASGPDDFSAQFFVMQDTHLPVLLRWSDATRGAPVQHQLFYADYREVDGLRWPFLVRHAVGAETVDETTFDRFEVNAPIDAGVFEARP